MDRRRYLLAMVNMYKYLPYYWQYLYHSLVPEKVAGFNKFDEEMELGAYSSSTGEKTLNSNQIRSKNYIRVMPNTTYFGYCSSLVGQSRGQIVCNYYDENKNFISYGDGINGTTFTTPNNCCYITIWCGNAYGTTYNHDICINVSSSLNGTYVPYKPHAVKDKARVKTIYGNSEVVNQLIVNGNFENNSGILVVEPDYASYSVANNTLTLTITNTIYSGTETQIACSPCIQNDYYLIKAIIKSNVNNNTIRIGYYANSDAPSGSYIQETINEGQTKYINAIIKCSSVSHNFIIVRFHGQHSAGSQIEVKKFQSINLSQRYPFDTPTTLTDPRVQNIINRGYIPYNTGEIKNVDIGLFSSECFNIFDKDYVKTSAGNYILNDNGVQIADNTSSYFEEYIDVLPNTEYYVNKVHVDGYVQRIYFYDNDYNWISRTSILYDTYTFTTPFNCKHIRFQYINTGTFNADNLCINVSSSMNGTYKPHNDFVDLANFKPNKTGTVENTFLQTNTANNFTKRVGVYTFTGNETIGDWGNNTFWFDGLKTLLKIPSGTNIANIRIAQLTADNYANLSNKVNDNAIAVYPSGGTYSGLLFFYKSSITTSADWKTFLAGKTIYFELATYQNISMPLRHLGMVDLGSLEWNYISSENRFLASVSGIKQVSERTNDVYCEKYLNDLGGFDMTKTGIIYHYSGGIYVQDKNYTDATTFKNSLQGQYLYFETADVVDETGIIIDNGTLPFKYQGGGVGTAHNILDRTNTEWVFTRNLFDVDLGTLSYTYESSNQRFLCTTTISNVKVVNNATAINGLCNKYSLIGSDYTSTTDKTIGVNTNGLIRLKDTSLNGDTSLITGTLEYQLATPQVTRIPRKHLAVVDLGGNNISYAYTSGDHPYMRSAIISSIVKKPENNNTKANIYCNQFITLTGRNISVDGQFGIAIDDTGYIRIAYNGMPTDTTTFKNLMSGIYLFYETQDEVADIDFKFDIEAGGTINASMFGWVKNQQVAIASIQSTKTVDGITFTNNGDGTLTIRGTAEANIETPISYVLSLSLGHKYYIGRGTNVRFGNGYTTNEIVSDDYDGGVMIIYAKVSNGTIVDETLPIMAIDLTLGFGAGNEPTSINDPRIQEIIRLGYIPTDTTGTYEEVECEVLPNVDVEVKAK